MVFLLSLIYSLLPSQHSFFIAYFLNISLFCNYYIVVKNRKTYILFMLIRRIGKERFKMKIYITRHGETFWNREGRVQSYSNTPETYLTEKGKEDAKKRGTLLSKEPIEVVYHSAMRRAKKTAEIISQSLECKTMIEDARINDSCLSFLDGLTIEEIKEKFPKEWEAREKDKFNYRLPLKEGYPAAESMKDVLHRVSSLLEKVVNDKKDTLMVGHRCVNRAILYYLLKDSDCAIPEQDLSKVKVPNEVIYRVTIKPGFKKVEYNLGEGWFDGVLTEQK